MLPGVLRYEDGIEMNQDIVIITTKGEAICTGERGAGGHPGVKGGGGVGIQVCRSHMMSRVDAAAFGPW